MGNLRDAGDVASALQAKGAVPSETHHTIYRLEIDGVVTLVTRISHGARQLDDYLLGMMAKQCALRKAEFLDLVDCPMSAEDWESLVRERCSDGRNPFTGR